MKTIVKVGKPGYKSGNKSLEQRIFIGTNPKQSKEFLVVKHKKETDGKLSIELHSTKESGVDMNWLGKNNWSNEQAALVELYGAQIVKSGVILFNYIYNDIDLLLTHKQRLIELARELSRLK